MFKKYCLFGLINKSEFLKFRCFTRQFVIIIIFFFAQTKTVCKMAYENRTQSKHYIAYMTKMKSRRRYILKVDKTSIVIVENRM